MIARCDQCGNKVERVWEEQSDNRSEWLCESIIQIWSDCYRRL